ncbi:MAG: LytTR family transcriptional regulator [Balneolales bacterium]|nr:LytTR family transcriptional regulator [Balneolales bacterium]
MKQVNAVDILHQPFPVNFIFRDPAKGVPVLMAFSFLFVLIYRPLGSHPGAHFSYEITMALYVLATGCAAYLTALFIRQLRGENAANPWNIKLELISILCVILAMGTFVFLMAFLLEEGADRWNLPTFISSLKSTALVAMIPFLAVTMYNARTMFNSNQRYINSSPAPDTFPNASQHADDVEITIQTQLRDENVTFLLREFVFAESDGNYVNFHLLRKNASDLQKVVARLSISSLEEQLHPHESFMRTHRAFIVNLRNVKESAGNALGLQLKLTGTNAAIPVSRSHVKGFKNKIKSLK